MAHLRNVIHMDVYGMFLLYEEEQLSAISLVRDNKNNRNLETQNWKQ